MKMFSSCSGECCVCSCESCWAGHGDDDFSVATAEQIIERLNKGRYPDYREYMINFLKDRYNIVYDGTINEQTRKQLTNDILNGTRQLVALSTPIANLTKELDKILKDFERQTIEKVLFSVLIRFYFADWTRACDYEKMTSEDVVNAAMAVCKEIEKEFNYDLDNDIMPDPFYEEKGKICELSAIEDKIEQGTLKTVKTCKNISEMNPVDGFTCSECGITIIDFREERVDEEDCTASWYEYEMKYCPNCGAKIEH